MTATFDSPDRHRMPSVTDWLEAPAELYRSPRWYACRTRARAEKKVDARLAGHGFETYLPLVERERQWADRKKVVPFPLFPGYVLARFDLTRLGAVLRVPGLVTVIRVNGYPTPIRDDELDSVRRLVRGANETGVLPSAADWLEPGEAVKVVDGPFEGMRGVLVEARGRARVLVKLSTIQQGVSVELDRAKLRPAAA